MPATAASGGAPARIPTLAAASAAPASASPAMKSAIVKPMPARQPPPRIASSRPPSGRRAMPERGRRASSNSDDADRLPDEESGGDGQRDRIGERARSKATPALASAKIGMITKRDPGMQRRIEVLERRDRLAAAWRSVRTRPRRSRRRRGIRRRASRNGAKAFSLEMRPRRGQQAEQHAGDRRVHAGLEEREPDDQRRATRVDAERCGRRARRASTTSDQPAGAERAAARDRCPCCSRARSPGSRRCRRRSRARGA